MIFVEKQFLEGIFQSPCFCLVLFFWYLGDSFSQTLLLAKGGFQNATPSEVKQAVAAAESFGETLDCPEALRHCSCAAALCEVPWSLKCAVAPNKVCISCKAALGLPRGVCL